MSLKYQFKTQPYSHQKKALNRILKLDGVAGLFMEMGTGKTKVAIDWAGIAHLNPIGTKKPVKKVLVICPVSVMSVWKRQIRQHSPVKARIALMTGRLDQRIRLVKLMTQHPVKEGIEWIIINYEALWRTSSRGSSMEDTLRLWMPDLVIADESHKIKTSSSKQSRSASRLAAGAAQKLILSGTPITKSPLDIYGQFRFLDPKILDMSWTSFKREYGVWGGYQGYQLKRYKNLPRLAEVVRAHSYRVRKEDCLDLPARTGDLYDVNGPNVVSVQLSTRAANIYEEMAKEMIVEFEEMEEPTAATAPIVLTKLLRLSQITSGFLTTEAKTTLEFDTSKRDMVMDHIRDVHEQGEKIVVFCRFKHDYQGLADAMTKQHIPFRLLSGSVPQSQRDSMVQAFQNDPNITVFVSQISSGSLGIDLTAASLCAFMSWDYRWDTYMQAIDRIHRNGQKKHCTYYHFAVPGTIDITSLNILKEKGNLAHAVVHDPNILRPKLGH